MNSNKKRIALFSAFSPDLGGGSVIVRSLIAQIRDADVDWFYNGNAPAQPDEKYLGASLMNARGFQGLWGTFALLTRRPHPGLEKIVDCLLRQPCDAYWIISHNEGMRVAYELAKRQSARKIHLSVHDDLEYGLCARSRRYRYFGRFAHDLTCAGLKEVDSFDVVSEGMRTHYRELSGRDSEVIHRYIAPEEMATPAQTGSGDVLRMGHIGSIYNLDELIQFIGSFMRLCRRRNKRPSCLFFGFGRGEKKLPDEIRRISTFAPTTPEPEAVRQLAECDFVYSMYPFSRRFRVFAQTSLPTKLGSYVMAGRPIFGHGPGDSSLAGFLGETGLGVLCTSGEAPELEAGLERLLSMRINPDLFEKARALYFGSANVDKIVRALVQTGP